MHSNVVADKDIAPKIEQEEEAQTEQKEDVLHEKNKTAQASDLSIQMERVICLKVPGLYQQKTHRVLNKITEHAKILTRNDNKKAVIYGIAFSGHNFNTLFKSMVNNQQNLNQVYIYEFLCALRSLDAKKDDISGEPLKIKYINVAPYSTHQRHSIPTKYED